MFNALPCAADRFPRWANIDRKSQGPLPIPPSREIQYDFFVSYASADNREGWVDAFVRELLAAHKRFTGGRELTYFLDRNNIQQLSHWHVEIFNKGLVRSRFFLAFLSPNYFASEICRREWKAWIDQEISLHILTAGAAPIYFVEVPDFLSKPILPERATRPSTRWGHRRP